MPKQVKCPVCGAELDAQVPDFCPTCGWECGMDITLIPSLSKPTDRDLEYYQSKLSLAKEHWNKNQVLLREQAKRLDDKDKELAAARKQLAEKDKDKAAANKESAKAQKQRKAIEEDKATFDRKLAEAERRIRELEAGKYQNQEKVIIYPQPVVSSPEMVLVEGGSFLMGSDDNDSLIDERPVHRVELSSFHIGKYPVTQKQWLAVMGSIPASGLGVGDNYPIYGVSWYHAIKYCNLLSIAEGLTPVYSILDLTNPAQWGVVPTALSEAWDAVVCDWSTDGYRLPTEAEWEYAARGGRKSKGYKYSGGDDIDSVAWYHENSGGKSHPVGKKIANELGLHDMSGNVCEWCWDFHVGYNATSQINPTGPAIGKPRLLRGGGWNDVASYCRVANRDYDYPGSSSSFSGFRLCRAIN